MNLTHLDEKNHPKMVDVSAKDISSREAVASGKIYMSEEAFKTIIENKAKKGPVLQTAITAAIMGAKQTSNIIPMCHPLMISKIQARIEENQQEYSFKLYISVKCEGKTGVEMESLTGVSIGLLTIYDMIKAIDKSMKITDIVLESKEGGKSGKYLRS
ncbi:cyclic pyranopterin monophosphate synthase MoaC [Campylobacter insulaenigrae]|uniref:Cyclic pyranopterin monophosphate synthase n=2 Tax=Campylobacter insulaenigrae TaxID=260714 RepID=A0A0A8GYZ6_9BACT|nr:cyclic pyranopterin monophosphate synthase MoaC [Campylobacter insulaenigrae]AJC87138.1 molybdenum cofactor biosynthesis protein C [Campylobacter insulaenigrae NCTC 12927]MCR6585335.1 cyclic pyranopterin monophosphate synthase MoaC [Campylobacter insulaenigrae]MCR6591918.1 cyclic pyranopterin monophosphate synthase MoaC [Campylobacter insulaenigrae]MCR6593405.1 cyclic pyranopterin monophosphate synthase MoaC [Campylobacter insulaenigrae]MCR6594943.1 cyclic pyranopterin monophosphate synthas